MDWNGNLRLPFVSRPQNSFSFLYSYDQFPGGGAEMKHPLMTQTDEHGVIPVMDKNNLANLNLEKKKRLTSDQLDSLESSFQEEIKLDPDRKMKLAQELGLQPRQVAVWFQNRRARWKAKQLERLYDALKQELDVVSREKQKLQEEVFALRAILKEEATKRQGSAGYTDVSGEETVESTSTAAIRGCSYKQPRATFGRNHQNNMGGKGNDQYCNYVMNIDDDFIPVMPPTYWGVMPPSNYP